MSEITIRISTNTLKLALVVLLAIIAIWLTPNVWSAGLFHPKYELHIFVPEAEGIWAGSLVTLEGISVGTVSSVRLATKAPDPNRKLDITLKVQKRFQGFVREDSSAALLTQGLLGDRFVSITRGFSGQSVPPGGEIHAVPVKELKPEDFLRTIDKIANCVNQAPNPANKNLPASSKRPADHQ